MPPRFFVSSAKAVDLIGSAGQSAAMLKRLIPLALFTLSAPALADPPLELEEEALERARAQVAARWAATIELSENGVALDHRSDFHPEGPHPDEADIALEVGTLHGSLLAWPRGNNRLMLGQ